MFFTANTFAICFNKDYLLTYLLTYNIQSVVHRRKFSMKQNVLQYCCLFSIWTTRKMHDFQGYFSRTLSFNFQDFPGPKWFSRTFQILEFSGVKNPGLSRSRGNPDQRTKPKKLWITKEAFSLRGKKTGMTIWLEEYKEIKSTIQKWLRKDKQNHNINALCESLEKASVNTHMREMLQVAISLSQEFNPQLQCIDGWRFGVAVTRRSRSTQLLYIEPG